MSVYVCVCVVWIRHGMQCKGVPLFHNRPCVYNGYCAQFTGSVSQACLSWFRAIVCAIRHPIIPAYVSREHGIHKSDKIAYISGLMCYQMFIQNTYFERYYFVLISLLHTICLGLQIQPIPCQRPPVCCWVKVRIARSYCSTISSKLYVTAYI